MVYRKAYIGEGFSPRDASGDRQHSVAPHTAAHPEMHRAASAMTVLAPLSFISVSTVLGFVQQGHSILRDTVSQLALGQYGFLQTAVFFFFGLALWVLAYRLMGSEGRKAWAPSVLLVMAGIGFVTIAIFPTQQGSATYLAGAVIHRNAAKTIAGLFPAIAGCTAFFFRHAKGWGPVVWVSVVLAAACAVLDVLGIFALDAESPLLGLLERGMLALGLVWVEVISLKLALREENARPHEEGAR